MRLTFNVDDTVAKNFLNAIPDRMRSKIVSELIRKNLEERKKAIVAACLAANKDADSTIVVDEWQSFDTKAEGDWE